MKLSKKDYWLVSFITIIVIAGFFPLSFLKISPGPPQSILKNLTTLSVYAEKTNIYSYILAHFDKNSELLKIKGFDENSANVNYSLTNISAKKSAFDLAKIHNTEKSLGYMILAIDNDSKFSTVLQPGDIIIKIDDVSVLDKELSDLKKLKPFKNRNVSFTLVRNNETITKQLKVANEIGKLSLVKYVDYITDNKSLTNDKMYQKININGSSVGLAYATYYYLKVTNQSLSANVAMTGTIDNSGNVGKIEGIREKIIGANKANAKYVFVPHDNYTNAVNAKNEFGYKMEIYPVSSLADTINYLTEFNIITKE